VMICLRLSLLAHARYARRMQRDKIEIESKRLLRCGLVKRNAFVRKARVYCRVALRSMKRAPATLLYEVSDKCRGPLGVNQSRV
jgi:hypothetical protein